MRKIDDPTLPGLNTALDTSAMADLFRKAFPECSSGVELAGVHIVDVRYQPDGPCWILYRLKVRSPGSRSRPVLVSARLLRPHEEASPVPPELLERFRTREDDLLRTPMAYLPELRLAAYAFPIDSALPWLFDVLDPQIMRRRLDRLWTGRNVHVCDVRIKPLGFTPQSRAAFLFEVLCEEKETGVPTLRRLVAKMHATKAASRLFAGAWALWRAGRKKVNLAPPVAYLGSASLTLQEQVSGERLGGLTSIHEFVKRVKQTARTVSALHRLPVPLTTRRKPEDEARVVHRWAGVLAAIRGDIGGRILKLRDRIAAELEARVAPTGPVHGDFHHTNVLVQEEGVVIIDLDEMAYGDPLLDVGRFLASLRIPAMRAFGSISALAEAGEVFLAEYMHKAPGDGKRVRLFEAASLFTAAASAFRIQRPNWEEEISLLMDEVERVLAGASCGAVAPVKKKQEPPPPVLEDPSSWVKDGTYLQAILDPYVRKAFDADLSSCTVVEASDSASNERHRYFLRGRRDGAKWSARVQGIAWNRHGGRDLLRRLGVLRSALEGADDVPLFPRPVAFLRPLSLIVWEVPLGARFSSLLGTEAGLAAASRIGEALAALHGVKLELDSSHPLEKELESLRRKVARLETECPKHGRQAHSLFEEVSARLAAAAVRSTPALRTVHPHHILLGERVGFAKVESVCSSHPWLDVADFLARLELVAPGHGGREAALEAGRRFREAYRQRSLKGPAAGGGASAPGMFPRPHLAAFEAGALLRLACSHLRRASEDGTGDRLLQAAASRLTQPD